MNVQLLNLKNGLKMEHPITKLPLWLMLTGLFLSLGLSSCYKDNEEDLYPSNGDTCNTQNVSFSQVIEPLIGNNCLSCHSALILREEYVWMVIAILLMLPPMVDY